MKFLKGYLVAAFLVGALIFSSTNVQAAGLSQDQIQSILNLLLSFGADSTVISNVSAALNGQPTSGTGTPSSCVDLTHNLYSGSTDAKTNGDVTRLQQFLGVNATGYFGPLTEQIVQDWQSSHGVVTSGSPDITGYGYVGTKTRRVMGCNSSQNGISSVIEPAYITVTGTSATIACVAGSSWDATTKTCKTLLITGKSGSSNSKVWFSPAPESPDYINLFTQPELWQSARSQIGVFKFGPGNVDTKNTTSATSYSRLKQEDVFKKLQQWGIDIAVEAPSVKEWDCSGIGDVTKPGVRGDARSTTLKYIQNVFSAGASVRYIAMDEPLVSGFFSCHLSVDETAARTANYAKTLLKDPVTQLQAPNLSIGDIEAYPASNVAQIKQWILALEKNGYKPAFMHLDIDMNDVVGRGSTINFEADLQALKTFFTTEGIPFGIIYWPGHDPEVSDAAYYADVMSLATRVHKAIGESDQAIFQSWVRRGPLQGSTCSTSDPSYCNKISVPLNLSGDTTAAFNHTKLVEDVIATLKSQSTPTWTTYCTGANNTDPANDWKYWQYADLSDGRHYQYLSPGDANCKAPVPIAPPSATSTIKGYVDEVRSNGNGSYAILGWACSTGYDAPVDIHLYLGGPAGSGVGGLYTHGTTNLPSELGVAAECHARGTTYRFNLTLGADAVKAYGGQPFFVHGISPIGGPNSVISNDHHLVVPTFTNTNTNPDGYLDQASCSTLAGWAYDADDVSASLDIHLYKDGPAGQGTFIDSYKANLSRPDVDSYFNITGDHGFTITTPSSLKDSKPHKLYIYAIDSLHGNDHNPLIANSPQTINCSVTAIAPIKHTLAQGWTGPEVTTLQTTLKNLGLFTNEITGYFGQATKAAVQTFQHQNNLAAVGVVGPKTREALGR